MLQVVKHKLEIQHFRFLHTNITHLAIYFAQMYAICYMILRGMPSHLISFHLTLSDKCYANVTII